ncbi:unnamed protein product [Parnassius apollo]|uniref:(apollo) hypothetical protein n=1 Tax=Parnassius apollo TaxID=110799 RepID=A0A8S3WHU7_PARAO|nr:unnamed protein product [Parnassius apollo]
MPRGRSKTCRILCGRHSLRSSERPPLNESQLARVLQEEYSDDGDFSSGSGDNYVPERDINQTESESSDIISQSEEEVSCLN